MLSDPPALNELMHIIPVAHRRVVVDGVDPERAWLVLLKLPGGWGYYGLRDGERAARTYAHALQFPHGETVALLKYTVLRDFDEQILEDAKTGS